ncbi:MAG: mannose-6-phosphate isomerase [Bacteroidetes bacterium]|nr:MAG: mannose-6-phosphate isomerase [Bacteroidota bacterium]
MSFNKFPSVRVKGSETSCELGWSNISSRIEKEITNLDRAVVVIECYQGVNQEELIKGLAGFDHVFLTSDAFKSEEEILKMTFPDVTDDRIFGTISKLEMADYLDKEGTEKFHSRINLISKGSILIIGAAASLLYKNPDLLIYADMARWEIQLRMRQNQVPNLGLNNLEDSFERQYKIGYFVDWRVCDKLKQELMAKWDFVIDTNKENNPKMATGEAITKTLEVTATQPFSVVPFFDRGPWGGQWMKEVCDLDRTQDNFAWCFNCVPEENSLLIEFDNTTFEIPSLNLVFQQPEELLGRNVYSHFGAEFPIRFDFLDTIEGGNLSLQVHPLTDYIKDNFGIDYTQDESYYIMDATEDAKVYLGLKDDIMPENMIFDLKKAQLNGNSFNADKYTKAWPAKKHDHFLIPAGTVHCSGTGCMVLEISATPYIFTFKLWDWGRVGLDGKPRPINIEHGEKVIQWDRTPDWTRKNLINNISTISSDKGIVEEKTGLHELEFIETRRYWFSTQISLDTKGTVNVLCLVDGDQALVESQKNAFEPFVVNYAEVFIVPAAVGGYTIRPCTPDKKLGILKAYVR